MRQKGFILFVFNLSFALVLCGIGVGCQPIREKVARLVVRLGIIPREIKNEEEGSELSPEAQAELLHEMFQVVLQREPGEFAEFLNLREAMEQGASLEGIYNGFSHSSDYRRLESSRRGASLAAVEAFSEEMSSFQENLPEVSFFNEKSSLPLARPVDLGSAGLVLPSPASTQWIHKGMNHAAMKFTFRKLFLTASVFTLKRVLADEAMKVVDFKKKQKVDLAKWYAAWTVHAVGWDVDFGLVLRNKPEEEFHFYWAMGASEDRLRWEILNRIHRILNEMNRRQGKKS